MKKIIFFGTPQIASEVLEHLILQGYPVVAVVCQPDKEVGRKRLMTPPPVKVVAERYQLPVWQFTSLSESYTQLLDIEAEVLLTCAYGQILPTPLLEAFPDKLNLHASLLPKYRGGSPIQAAIFYGDTETGISFMEMTARMDAGKVFAQEAIAIDPDETTTSLFRKLTQLAKEMIDRYLTAILRGEIEGQEQDPALVTFAYNFDRSVEKIDLTKEDRLIYAHVRTFLEDIGAYLWLGEKKLKLWSVPYRPAIVEEEKGQLVYRNQELLLALSEGYLVIHELQLEGKKRMTSHQFYQGLSKEIIYVLR